MFVYSRSYLLFRFFYINNINTNKWKTCSITSQYHLKLRWRKKVINHISIHRIITRVCSTKQDNKSTATFFFLSWHILPFIMANRQGRRNRQTTRINPVTNRSNIHTKTQVLRITLIVTVVSFLTFLITLLSSQWIIITYPPDFFATRQQMFVVRSTYGIIWECLLGVVKQNSMIGSYFLLDFNLLIFRTLGKSLKN